MKIEKMISQYRRDFIALMRCEFCGFPEKIENGYDDRFYHDNVIPNMKCSNCGKSTISGGGKIEYTPTKYSDDAIV